MGAPPLRRAGSGRPDGGWPFVGRLGAQAGWLGTRFLTALEASTHALYRDRVIAATGADAVHTMCFDGGWPGAAHRAIRNSTLTRWEAAGRPAAPNRPGEGDVVATDATGRVAHLRYGDMRPLPGMGGDLEAMALYAGQSAGLVTDVASAADIMARIVREATEVLSALSRTA